MQRRITKWIRLVRPFVEKEFGPLPRFRVRAGRLPAGWAKGKTTVPWTCDLDDEGMPTLTYYPKYVQRDLREADYDYLLYALIHDLMHIYQKNALALADEPPTGTQWSEGSAELATWKVLAKLHASPRRLDSLMSALFGPRLERWAIRELARDLRILHRRGIIGRRSLAALRLPFPLPKATRERIQRYRPPERTREVVAYELPYTLGLARCSRIVSSGIMTIEELLRTPMTDRKLRQLAGI